MVLIESIEHPTLPLVDFKGELGMTTPEDPVGYMDELKQSLRVAWSLLASPLLTPFERREARNEIKQYGAELRRCLRQVEAELDRCRKQPEAERYTDDAFEQIGFRILA